MLVGDFALVKDINASLLTSGSGPRNMTEFHGLAYFSAATTLLGEELWKSDGTEGGTFRVTDMASGSGDSYPTSITLANNMLFVVAATQEFGREIWSADLNATPIGDYDRNSLVDGADLLLWQRQLGSTATPAGSGADGDGDGTVEADDLAIWRARLGPLPSTAAASAAASKSSALFVETASVRDALFSAGDLTSMFVDARTARRFRPSVRPR